MFELTWTWPNFTFGQLFMWIGANNDQIWLPMGWVIMSNVQTDLELDLISLLVNFLAPPAERQRSFSNADSSVVVVVVVVNFSLKILISQKLPDNFFSSASRKAAELF